MFANGVVDEVRKLKLVGATAEQTLGLARIQRLIAGEISEQECIAQIQQATRRYAKRQLTWFRRQTNFEPLNLSRHGHAGSHRMDPCAKRVCPSRTGMIETSPKEKQERALLIGLEQNGVSKWDLRDSMEELRELANSAGAEVVDTVTQKLQKPTAPYYIGKGKAELIKDSLQDRQVTSVIFDDELSPAQGRNLETLLARKVLDRTQLILDIFARAQPRRPIADRACAIAISSAASYSHVASPFAANRRNRHARSG